MTTLQIQDAHSITTKQKRRVQTRLREYVPVESKQKYTNILPTGDKMVEREENDGLLRIGSQNVRGTSLTSGLEVPHEIDAMHDMGMTISGMCESNRPWTPGNKWEYDFMMQLRFKESRTVYSSAPSQHDQVYQPGGCILTVNGGAVGRIAETGTDSMGRYCWMALRGRRDEGVLFIQGYRTCHEASHNPGPNTAYMQQYTCMRAKGIKKPNPRKQMLKDILRLIQDKRSEGFRPVLMWDANGDYITEKGRDEELETFVRESLMDDPFYDKFLEAPRTYMYGTKRLDYILMDPALVPAIVRIGYLGTHDGAFSDHVMAYVDFDEKKLFKGLINRPVTVHSRDFLIEQDDKMKAYIEKLIEEMKRMNMRDRTFQLSRSFAEHGKTTRNVREYNKMYKQAVETMKSVAAKVSRKKWAYMNSTELALAGRYLLLYKQITDCSGRDAPATDSMKKRATKLGVDLDKELLRPYKELRKEVHVRHQEMWQVQKNAEGARVDWLRQVAQDRAKALNDPDWEEKMESMMRIAKQRAVNRKLTAVIKGRSRCMDRIQVTDHEWFYSKKKEEIYKFQNGVFEAYPSAHDGTYFTHHTLKVPYDDTVKIKVERDKPTSRWRVAEVLQSPYRPWRDVTSQDEMEDILLERNKRHLQQTAMEDGMCMEEPMKSLRENHGHNDMAKALLEGNYETEIEISKETAALFEVLKQTEEEKTCPPVLGEIPMADFQEMFKVKREGTSSDPRTPNYTLWKCVAHSNYLSSFMCVLVSLPFQHGFVNDMWTHMSDFMIEKGSGSREVHMLRIIGKVAAEMNTALGYLLGRRAAWNYEACNPSDEQHGGRPNRSSVDAAMLKLLTFECARVMYATIGMVQHDATAHFDRILKGNATVFAMKLMVSWQIMMSIALTIHSLKRNVETGLGVSEKHYYQERGQPEIGGLVQGKADVPIISNMQGDACFKAHGKLAPGLVLKSANMEREIRHHSIAFVDDADGHVSASVTPDNELNYEAQLIDTVRKLNQSANTWSRIVHIWGGLSALHKTNWQVLAWELEKGKLKIIQSTDEEVIMEDGKGAYAIIKFSSPDEPNKGLGYRLCPNGNQKPHLKATLSAIRKICASASGAFLNESEAIQMLSQRLIPKLSYSMHLTSWSRNDCKPFNALIRKTLVPLMRLNRNYPSALLYGSAEYGGMELPDVYTLQDQVQLPYLLKQLRWDQTVANDFLTTLDCIQVRCGFTSPILESVQAKIEYMGPSLILDIRRRLSEMDGQLWVEDAWQPSHQRVGDHSIMERFLKIPGVTAGQLEKANEVRLYLRVITIADLADPGGSLIPSGMLDGSWQAGSDLKWPIRPCPPPAYWRWFRTLLRKSFCTNAPLYQRGYHSMDLDNKLGRWYPVKRNTWHHCYRSHDCLYWRGKDCSILQKFKRSKVSGFYNFEEDVTSVPLDAHPIGYRQVGESLWTQRKYSLQQIATVDPPPGHTVTNTFSDPTCGEIVLGSDGSVHLHEEVATAAWMIYQDDDEYATACFLLANMNSVSSYRTELEGMFRGLKHINRLQMTPTEVKQWCDNERAVLNCANDPRSPTCMLQADADIILAIRKIHQDMPFEIQCRHVYGHQDSKSERKEESVPVKRTKIAIDNADEIAVTLELFPNGEQQDTNKNVTVNEEVSRAEDWIEDAISQAFQQHKVKNPYEKIQSSQTKKKLSLEAKINIACDELATETSAAVLADGVPEALPSTLQLPYAGSKALLKLGKTWITSNYKSAIRKARWDARTKEYCMTKYDWSEETFNSVNWKSIGLVRRRMTKTKFMQTSKIMHGWLPTMHMRQHITGISQCPGCACQDETIDHMVRCPSAVMKAKRDEIITAFRKKGLASKVPNRIITAITEVISTYFKHAKDYAKPAYITSIKDAIMQQEKIGFNLMMRGFLAKGWLVALKAVGTSRPEQKMDTIQKLFWEEVIEPLWHTRNDILHKNKNRYLDAEKERLGERIQWYVDNKHKLLAVHDFKLARFDVATIHRMDRRARREWIRHLDVARAAYTNELKQRASKLNVITRYMTFKSAIETMSPADDENQSAKGHTPHDQT